MSEADIKILEKKLKQWEPYKNIKFPTPIEREIQKENRAIENLLNKYKEQEKMIVELIEELNNAVYNDYSACYCYAYTDMDTKDCKKNCVECISNYIRKKVEE